MKAVLHVLLLFSLCQANAIASSNACEGNPWPDCFEGDEGLELLQHRGAATGHVEAQLPRSAALWLVEHLSNVPSMVAQHKLQLVWLYSLWPLVVALGLPALLSRGGLIQVLAFTAFWVLLRPCATMLQVLGSQIDPAEAQVLHSLWATSGFTADAMSLTAHFYWSWGLFELVVRRRPLTQRLLAVSCLAAWCLPVPLAQLSLGLLRPRSAVASALLGDVLGVAFFFCLRSSPCWGLIQALHQKSAEGEALVRLHDNLTTFWGGCHWPRRPNTESAGSYPSKSQVDKAAHDLTMAAHDFSDDEDLKLVRQ